MKWICENCDVTDEMIKAVENQIGFKFPEDFIENIKLHDGGYPIPNKIIIDGQEEILNNLISFIESDASYILNIMRDTEGLDICKFVPIGEDPFGNLFCYYITDDNYEIVFCNHEEKYGLKYVCSSFDELISMLCE